MAPLTVLSRELTVRFIVSETGETILPQNVEVYAAGGKELLTKEHKITADSSLVFTLTKECDIEIAYNLGKETYSEKAANSCDTITIAVPRILLPYALKEIEVTGRDVKISDNVATFYPAKGEKKISLDATSLLTNMAIPTVNVNGENGKLTTSGGEEIAAFIDYRPASSEDLTNVRPQDVKRVEVIDFPRDPRFGGKHHVVNFIMIKYEYGGYTKIDAMQRLRYNTGNYNVFSKMSYKDMTYEIGARYGYNHTRSAKMESSEFYDFGKIKVTKSLTPEKSLRDIRNSNSFFRAAYSSDKTVITNTIGVISQRIPTNDRIDRIDYDNTLYESSTFETKRKSSNLSGTWQGNYHFFLPHDFTLIVNGNASYGKFARDYCFTDFADESIVNDVSEHVWNTSFDAGLTKQLGRHSANISVYGGMSGNDIRYRGTSPTLVDGKTSYISLMLEGQVQLGNVWITPSVNMIKTHMEINGFTVSSLKPRYFLSAYCQTSGSSNLSFSSMLYYMIPNISHGGPNIQMSDQISGVGGNPSLEPQTMLDNTLQFQCFTGSKFGMSAYTSFSRYTNLMTSIEEPKLFDGRQVMITTRINSGFQNKWEYGVTGSLKLFNNSLTLKASLNGTSISLHGPFSYSSDFFNFYSFVSYRVGNFFMSSDYSSRSRSVTTDDVERMPATYSLKAGWGNGRVLISADARNIFSSSKESILWRNTNNYSRIAYYTYPEFGRYFTLTFSYSFSYGKKVEKSQNTSGPTGVSSGMLNQ